MYDANAHMPREEGDVESSPSLSRLAVGSGPASHAKCIEPLLITSAQAAAILAISERSLRRLRNMGLKYVVLGTGIIRYRRADIESYIGENTCHFAPKHALLALRLPGPGLSISWKL